MFHAFLFVNTYVACEARHRIDLGRIISEVFAKLECEKKSVVSYIILESRVSRKLNR